MRNLITGEEEASKRKEPKNVIPGKRNNFYNVNCNLDFLLIKICSALYNNTDFHLLFRVPFLK